MKDSDIPGFLLVIIGLIGIWQLVNWLTWTPWLNEEVAWYHENNLEVDRNDCIREVEYFEGVEPAKEFAASILNPFVPIVLVESKLKGHFVGVYNSDDLSYNEQERLEFEYGDCLDTEKLSSIIELDSSGFDSSASRDRSLPSSEPGARDDLREKYLD